MNRTVTLEKDTENSYCLAVEGADGREVKLQVTRLDSEDFDDFDHAAIELIARATEKFDTGPKAPQIKVEEMIAMPPFIPLTVDFVDERSALVMVNPVNIESVTSGDQVIVEMISGSRLLVNESVVEVMERISRQ